LGRLQRQAVVWRTSRQQPVYNTTFELQLMATEV